MAADRPGQMGWWPRWGRFIRGLGPERPRLESAAFITDVLGYQLTDFHRRWLEFVSGRRRALVLAPRGHGKSTILTIAASIQRTLENPDLRVLIASASAAQAEAFLREIRRQLETNRKIVRAYGDFRGHPWTQTEICFRHRVRPAKESTITALGVAGPIISRHYDLIILDDVVNEESILSRARRERLVTWYYKELLPTLEPDGTLWLVGTRYHPDDLYGRLLAAGAPALVERAIVEADGVERALWEKKFPLERLRRLRAEAGPAIFNAQYQNDVAAMGGRIFRPEWILPRPGSGSGRRYQGVDLAMGRGDQHDYFAHVTVAEAGPGRFHVLGAYRGRLSFEEQFRTIVALYDLHHRPEVPVARVGVEATGYQEAMVQRLRLETRLPLAAVKPTRDKIARAMSIQGLFETGAVTIEPAGSGRGTSAALPDLIAELLEFPDADHDDLFDALEIALSLARSGSSYADLPMAKLELEPS